ncbi:hypothetical protein RB653_009713 [Dictyostelium firmibasis]|uniref:Uncharacterized protein n=1 Tax=Dictyostelium firmibasis TaxID=79012 RepID=A0AAN7YNY5_9MYCE
MNTTVNNNSNDQSYGSSSTDNNTNSMDIRMKSIEDQINKLTLTFSRYVKEPITSNNNISKNQENNNNSDKENEDNDDDSNNDVDIPTEYQLSDSLFNEYKHLLNNQGSLVEEQCILKKNDISDFNKTFCFPSNFQVNVAPFGTPDGITASSHLKNNDSDLFIVEKRINDILKPILLISNMLSSTELLSYLADSTILLTINAQASLSRVRRNNISKEIYGSEVVQPIKIKDTPKLFDETETESIRKLSKVIRKNNETKQSLSKISTSELSVDDNMFDIKRIGFNISLILFSTMNRSESLFLR